jgi:hypothetical protein
VSERNARTILTFMGSRDRGGKAQSSVDFVLAPATLASAHCNADETHPSSAPTSILSLAKLAKHSTKPAIDCQPAFVRLRFR